MQLLVLYLALQLDSLLDLLVVKTSCSALSAAILKEYYYCAPFLACHKTVFTSMITLIHRKCCKLEHFVKFWKDIFKQTNAGKHAYFSKLEQISFIRFFSNFFLQESESETLLIGQLRGERFFSSLFSGL